MVKNRPNKVPLRWLAWLLSVTTVALFSNWAGTILKPQPAQAQSAKMILFFDGPTIPGGWTSLSASASDIFYQKFPRGNSTYGSGGGADTHTHLVTVSNVSGPSNAWRSAATGTALATSTHDHGFAAVTDAQSSQPSRRELQVMQYNAGIPSGASAIPDGAIAIFDTTSMPAGWTRYSEQDNYFVRGGPDGEVTGGGSITAHATTITQNTSVTTGIGNTGAFPPAQALPPHTHTVGIQITEGGNHTPVNIYIVLGKISGAGSIPGGMLAMFTAAPGGSWVSKSANGEDFYQKYFEGKSAYAASGDGAATHNHDSAIGVSTNANDVSSSGDGGGDNFAALDGHTHTFDLTYTAADNLPAYIDVLVYKYPAYTPQMNNWQWFADEGDETPGTAYANETTGATPNEPPQVEMGKNIPLKLRINITETAGAGEDNSRKELQWSTDQSNWTGVSEAGVLGTFVYTTDISGGDDNVAITTQLLTGTTQSGIHNESNSAGPSNSDHTASATLELEYAFETSILVAVNTAYYFQLYDEVLAAAIPLASGKCRPKLTTAAAFSLTTSAPSAVFLGTWNYGDGEYHGYTFTGGEEITNRDNRGLTGGNSSGWTCSADITTQLTSGSNTILKSNMYWITNTITGLYDAPTAGMSGNFGEYMGSAVTAITAAGSGYQGLGGFTILPTIRIYGAPAQGDYTGGVLTLTTI